jgi:hypothetical protein
MDSSAWDSVLDLLEEFAALKVAEAMPTEEESEKKSYDFVISIFNDNQKVRMADTMWGWQKCFEWFRSRMEGTEK